MDSNPEEQYSRDPAARDERTMGAEAMPESESKGRDVRDLSREGVSHGRDVTEEENPEEVESTGRDVVDRSRRVEVRGVDVIDLGPIDPDLEPDQTQS